jgi:hypothetical protein
MKGRRVVRVWAVLALLASLGIGVGSASSAGATSAMDELAAEAAVGTVFTYQGLLRDGSGPVNATCDLQFKLWDAASGGAQVGGTILLEDVLLADGLFTARLDFGAAAFRGQARYLEVSVACPTGSAFVPLPRQELTGSPHALWALGAPWSGLEGVPADLADGDQDTTYTPGAGLVLEGTEFRVNRGEVQWRVSQTCAAGSSIRAIDVDGTVTCEVDDNTTYTPGTGLSLVGGQFSVNFGGSGTASTASRSDHNHDAAYVNEGQANSVSTGMVQNSTLLLEDLNQNGCSTGQVIKWSGSAWACAADQTAAGSYWSLNGNAGTVPGTNYLGTTDNAALELKVNGARALRLEPNTTSPNLLGGYSGNSVADGVYGATIAGGGESGGYSNQVTGARGTVSGGAHNQAAAAGTVGGGFGNVAADEATVAGGLGNSAVGLYATIAGGNTNTASNVGAAVGGGWSNAADGWRAAVGGGSDNTASGESAVVGGGYVNTASGVGATVSGGSYNTASGQMTTVGGGGDNDDPGLGNRATDDWGTVGGGQNNQAGDNAGTPDDRPYATVGGGRDNVASGEDATVGGGWGNRAAGWYATISGGHSNTASNVGATVGGGWSNDADHWYATVGGGISNTASGERATVGGGWANVASAVHSTVAGGAENRASDNWGTVAGGYNNQAGDNAGSIEDRPYATVGGGRDNIASGTSSVVAGGDTNTASGWRSTVPGGVGNTAAGDHSFAAGRRAKANHSGAFVWADDLNVDFASTNTNTFRVRATNGAEFVANNAGYGLIAANNGAGDGLRAMTNSSAGSNWAAVYAVNLGTSPAVYADSAGTYSGYFLDNIYVDGNCVGCTTAFLAVNDGDRVLEIGDLVAAKGLLDPVAGSGQPTLAVGLAGGNNMGVIGVVQGRVALTSSEKDGVESQSMELAEGAVSPGEYLLVVVQGFARIKVDASAGSILPGQRLTAGRQAGTARALETREMARR